MKNQILDERRETRDESQSAPQIADLWSASPASDHRERPQQANLLASPSLLRCNLGTHLRCFVGAGVPPLMGAQSKIALWGGAELSIDNYFKRTPNASNAPNDPKTSCALTTSRVPTNRNTRNTRNTRYACYACCACCAFQRISPRYGR